MKLMKHILHIKEISQEFKITNPPIKLLNKFGFTFFFIRMLYSCLVDADFQHRRIMTNGKTNRTIKYDFKSMLDSLNKV